jgi:hypothetical protein
MNEIRGVVTLLQYKLWWQIENVCWVLVAHACFPSYSGGRDQEDCSSKPPWANGFPDPVSKKPSQKRAGGVG